MSKAVATRDNQTQAVEAIRSRSDQFLDLLGGDARARDRWLTVALHAVTSNPDILKCEPMTVVEAVRQSASMGLELNGLLGDGYLIAYGNKAQFQPGYRGLLRLARRSQEIATIDAQMVYGHDEFEMDLGSEPRITHKPALSDRGERVGVYGYARLTSGELVPEWMDNAQIEMVRRSSRGQSGPWVEWYDEMARKTVIKRLMKRLPLDSLAQRALEAEARADNERSSTSSQSRREQPAAAVQRVHERLGITAGRDATGGQASVGPDTPTAAQVRAEAASEVPGYPADIEVSGLDGDMVTPLPTAAARQATSHSSATNAEAGKPTAAQDSGEVVGREGSSTAGSASPESMTQAPEGAPSSSDEPPPPSGAVDFCGHNGGMLGTCSRAPGHTGKHMSEDGAWAQKR